MFVRGERLATGWFYGRDVDRIRSSKGGAIRPQLGLMVRRYRSPGPKRGEGEGFGRPGWGLLAEGIGTFGTLEGARLGSKRLLSAGVQIFLEIRRQKKRKRRVKEESPLFFAFSCTLCTGIHAKPRPSDERRRPRPNPRRRAQRQRLYLSSVRHQTGRKAEQPKLPGMLHGPRSLPTIGLSWLIMGHSFSSLSP